MPVARRAQGRRDARMVIIDQLPERDICQAVEMVGNRRANIQGLSVHCYLRARAN